MSHARAIETKWDVVANDCIEVSSMAGTFPSSDPVDDWMID